MTTFSAPKVGALGELRGIKPSEIYNPLVKRYKRGFYPLAILCFGMLISVNVSGASAVETNQDMLLFPTDGMFNPKEKTWVVPIHGWMFKHKQAPHLKNKIVSELENIFGSAEIIHSNQYFQSRLKKFAVENIIDKEIRINIGQKTLALPATTKDGHFEAEIAVPAAELYRKKCSDWVMYDVVQEQPDSQQFLGQTQCVETEGVSVISSIDDTIKVTNVSDKQAALANTFLKKYVPIPEMAEAYRAWRERGWRFHYVSSLPWQLYPPLVNFMEMKGFPLGGFYFRRFHTKDESIAELFTNSGKYNFQAIQSILMHYPRRQFILVGNTGGRDPEVYSRVARLFPNQIKHIFIRPIDKQKPNNKRLQNTFEDLPNSLWSIFTEGRELYN